VLELTRQYNFKQYRNHGEELLHMKAAQCIKKNHDAS